ncbi:hypothetical protein [Methylomicrobium lacus]|uniref:hypothetical protein n=1 Tax=Methylomicrobium lacus TaxID=136992 RepID=UPI0035A83770
MDKFFSKYLDESDLHALSSAVHTGYWSVEHLFEVNTILGRFPPGLDQRPRLINVFVEYYLTKISNKGFRSEIKKNHARNCNHVRLYKDDLTITQHFLGSTSPRSMARKAIYRGVLTALNYDLFSSFEEEETDHDLYGHLYHYGLKNPEVVMLAVPDTNQGKILGKPLLLPKIEKQQEKESVEEIKDTIEHVLKEALHEDQRKEKTS